MTIKLEASGIQKICKAIKSDQLDGINQLVLFIGHAHSGHSIIGSTLDLHHQVAISNEVNIVKMIKDFKLTTIQIESIILYFSLKNVGSEAWQNSEYQYGTSSSFQGKTTHPQVIGDKKAGGTTRILLKNPWVLDYLLEHYENKIKFVFVQRKPVDVVAAYSYYMKQKPSQFHVDRYLENLNMVKAIKDMVFANQFIQISQYEFVNNPVETISTLFDSLGLEGDQVKIKNWVKNVRSDIPGKSTQIKIPTQLLEQLPACRSL